MKLPVKLLYKATVDGNVNMSEKDIFVNVSIPYIQQGKKLIEGNDTWANIAYYCFHKLHMLPSQLMSLPENEQAFIVAAIDIKVKHDKKEAQKLKSKGRGKR